MTNRLTHDQLATLVPELLLTGQLIDRSGMAHLIAAFGRDGMGEVAIEEWMAASPVYTGRIRAALGIDGDGVADMIKCLQLDIGAPPQFMDFRYQIDDEYHGSFVLDHCGALLDVEPMGDEYVTTMCHTIEDPTFDATAIATNRRARIRPVHRPPRVPVDRSPHCEWTITIEPDRDELPLPEVTKPMLATRAAIIELSQIDADATDGLVDYRGPVVDDLAFDEWSTSALVRIVEEVTLQHQLLALGFLDSVRRRTDEATADDIFDKQLTGIAGIAAERVTAAVLDSKTDAAALVDALNLNPVFGPVQYTGFRAELIDDEHVEVHIPHTSAALEDGGWMRLLVSGRLASLQAAATAIDPTWVVGESIEAEVDGSEETVVRIGRGEAQRECGEVAIVRFSAGSSFTFTDRGPSRPLPLSVV
ncbi:hypothetical protein SAMN04488550_3650 [Gordonia malaquae]|uniref:Uncharacterized protein n=1 Tax=Gordonia malaquae NBRC 108250 TaxID=1223542 RepID=M3V050_GORML|nr:hypothetical protein [Gordonia malaquae]GAC81727.1 hypothetical protein GM1_042_00430 [Gordonia malaquae NBRC 108250]SEE00859.1 hypothetical protein SAMN04488550_3650 [Gordonia malaquae]